MKLSLKIFAGMGVLALCAAGCGSADPHAGSHAGGSPPSGTASAQPAPSVTPSPSLSVRPGDWAAATSAAEGGGMAALIAAAQKEGSLNVIGLPPTWANYGAIIKTFSKRYGILVHSIAPGATSGQEIAALRHDNGSSAPDVLDLQPSDAVGQSRLFARYQVATWAAIPADQKAADGSWAADYGGFMSIGYNAARFGTVTSIRQLLASRFARAVALDGNPVQARAALYGVMMATLAFGGTPGSIARGVRFFRELQVAGNLVLVPGTTPMTIEAGSTPVVFNWDYLNTAAVVGQPKKDWKVFIPAGAALGAFNAQAISKKAPHPAAARLWEEFLYSQGPRGGQNLWLEGGVRPVEQAAMIANKTIDPAASRTLPPVPSGPVFLTPRQAARAAAYLRVHWPRVVG